MSIFSQTALDQINKTAEKSEQFRNQGNTVDVAIKHVSRLEESLKEQTQKVMQYFNDSDAILITTTEDLNNYVDSMIEFGYGGIDTETTGLDRVKDKIVGVSLYVPGRPECYIPINHISPILETRVKNQLEFSDLTEAFQKIVNSDTRLIFANADFDLAMIYKDIHIDFNSNFYYDVILAWRCLKEDEKDNSLKGLYAKYVEKGKVDPMKFSDFFSPTVFPYSKPSVAMLYAANDAKITYELFKWQLPYVTKSHIKCQKHKLEQIADLIWSIEFPLVPICQNMHRIGIYLDKQSASVLGKRYNEQLKSCQAELKNMVAEELSKSSYVPKFDEKVPFVSAEDFNSNSPQHVAYLLYKLMNLSTPEGKKSGGTGKDILAELNVPITRKLLEVRSISKLITSFVDKLPRTTTSDGRVHASFKQTGASTGRFSSESPNLQNIPSHALDIRHMFRATPADSYVIDVDSNSVSLPNYHILTTQNGDKLVKDIQVEDKVQFIENGKEVYKCVKSIKTSSKDSTLCDVVFRL